MAKAAVDLYAELSVSPEASPATIKAAHRKLSKRHHPDVKKTGDIDRFRAIDTAYKVLRDPKKRAAYDETGTFSLESVQTEMQKVITVMVDIYNRLLADGQAFDESVSIIDLMGKLITENLKRLKGLDAEIEGRIKQLRSLRRTITRDDDGDNLFARATDEHINRRRDELGQIRDQVCTLKLVQDELGNYSSFARAAQAMHFVWASTTSATTTTA